MPNYDVHAKHHFFMLNNLKNANLAALNTSSFHFVLTLNTTTTGVANLWLGVACEPHVALCLVPCCAYTII